MEVQRYSEGIHTDYYVETFDLIGYGFNQFILTNAISAFNPTILTSPRGPPAGPGNFRNLPGNLPNCNNLYISGDLFIMGGVQLFSMRDGKLTFPLSYRKHQDLPALRYRKVLSTAIIGQWSLKTPPWL